MYMYVALDDLEEPLIPSHLIVGRRLMNFLDNFCHEPEDFRATLDVFFSRWARYLSSTPGHFWKKWRWEYCIWWNGASLITSTEITLVAIRYLLEMLLHYMTLTNPEQSGSLEASRSCCMDKMEEWGITPVWHCEGSYTCTMLAHESAGKHPPWWHEEVHEPTQHAMLTGMSTLVCSGVERSWLHTVVWTDLSWGTAEGPHHARRGPPPCWQRKKPLPRAYGV